MRTKRFFVLQPYVTVKGTTSYVDPLVQPQNKCADGEQADQVALGISILGNTVASGSTLCSLVIQGALVPEGPWASLTTISLASVETRHYYTSDEEGTNRFQRFLRWKLDPSGCADDWSMTFKIDGVMK